MAEQTPIFAQLVRDVADARRDPPGRHHWREPWPVTADPDPPTVELPAQRKGP